MRLHVELVVRVQNGVVRVGRRGDAGREAAEARRAADRNHAGTADACVRADDGAGQHIVRVGQLRLLRVVDRVGLVVVLVVEERARDPLERRVGRRLERDVVRRPPVVLDVVRVDQRIDDQRARSRQRRRCGQRAAREAAVCAAGERGGVQACDDERIEARAAARQCELTDAGVGAVVVQVVVIALDAAVVLNVEARRVVRGDEVEVVIVVQRHVALDRRDEVVRIAHAPGCSGRSR